MKFVFFFTLVFFSTKIFAPSLQQQYREEGRSGARMHRYVSSSSPSSSYDPYSGVTLGETEIDSGFARRRKPVKSQQELIYERIQQIDQQIAQNRAKRNQIINEFNESQRQAVERVKQLKNEINSYKEAMNRYEKFSSEHKLLSEKLKELDEALEKNREAQSQIFFNPYFDFDLFPIEIPEKTFEEVVVPGKIQIKQNREIRLAQQKKLQQLSDALQDDPKDKEDKNCNKEEVLFECFFTEIKIITEEEPLEILKLLDWIKTKIKAERLFETQEDNLAEKERADFMETYFGAIEQTFLDYLVGPLSANKNRLETVMHDCQKVFDHEKFVKQKKELIFALLCWIKPKEQHVFDDFFAIASKAKECSLLTIRLGRKKIPALELQNFAEKMKQDLEKILNQDKNYLDPFYKKNGQHNPAFFEIVWPLLQAQNISPKNTDDLISDYLGEVLSIIAKNLSADDVSLFFSPKKHVASLIERKIVIPPATKQPLKNNKKSFSPHVFALHNQFDNSFYRLCLAEDENRQFLELQLQEGLSRNRTQKLEKANQIQQEKDAYNKEIDAADEANQISIEILQLTESIEDELERLSPSMPIDEISKISKEKFVQFSAKLKEFSKKAKGLIFKDKVLNDIRLAAESIEKTKKDFEEKIEKLKPLKDKEKILIKIHGQLVTQVDSFKQKELQAAEDCKKFGDHQNNSSIQKNNEIINKKEDEIDKINEKNSEKFDQANLEVKVLDEIYEQLRQEKANLQ